MKMMLMIVSMTCALSSFANAGDAVDCAMAAMSSRNADIELNLTKLCAGATSTAPVDCAIKALNSVRQDIVANAFTLCAAYPVRASK